MRVFVFAFCRRICTCRRELGGARRKEGKEGLFHHCFGRCFDGSGAGAGASGEKGKMKTEVKMFCLRMQTHCARTASS